MTNYSYSDTIDLTLNLTNLIGIKLIGIVLILIKTVGHKNGTKPCLDRAVYDRKEAGRHIVRIDENEDFNERTIWT